MGEDSSVIKNLNCMITAAMIVQSQAAFGAELGPSL